MSEQDQLAALEQLLAPEEHDTRPIIIMMCGVAGSGKTTIAKEIVARYPSYARLSIDEIIAEKHGLFGVDYPTWKYSEYQDEADKELEMRMLNLLEGGESYLVIDRSFWSRAAREGFRKVVEPYGARVVLLYLRPQSKEFIRERIDKRRERGRDANSALDIDDALLEDFWTGFEPPQGEGEIVIEVQSV